jgi:hypothetical protein
MKILLVQPAKPEKALGGEDFHTYEPILNLLSKREPWIV